MSGNGGEYKSCSSYRRIIYYIVSITIYVRMSLAGLIGYASDGSESEGDVGQTDCILLSSEPEPITSVAAEPAPDKDTESRNDNTAALEAKKIDFLSKLVKRRSDKHKSYDGSFAEKSRQSIALFLEMDDSQTSLTEVKPHFILFLFAQVCTV